MNPSDSPPTPHQSKLPALALAGLACAIFAVLALAGVAILGKHARVQAGPSVMTMETPDGLTVKIGNDPAKIFPPRWVPIYPAVQEQGDQTKEETKDTIRGTYRARTKDTPEKVKEYFESTLQADGFETEAATTETDGSESAVVTAKMDSARRKITVNAGAERGHTNLVITYEGPK